MTLYELQEQYRGIKRAYELELRAARLRRAALVLGVVGVLGFAALAWWTFT